MAKRVMKWTLNNNTLGVSKIAEGEDAKNAVIVLEAEFDLVSLYADFEAYNDVQKQIVVYGVKQKLSDSGASNIADFGGKIQSARDKWAELLEGKWTGSRVNATGVAEKKRFHSDVTAMASEVSLNGLMMKKALSAMDNQPAFTDEDEKKLQEFLDIKVGIEKKAKN